MLKYQQLIQMNKEFMNIYYTKYILICIFYYYYYFIYIRQYAHKHIDNNPVLFQQIVIPYHLVKLSNGTLRPANGLEKESNEKLKRLYNSTIDVMNQVITHIIIPRVNNPNIQPDNNDDENDNRRRTTSKRDSIINVSTPVQILSQQLYCFLFFIFI